MASTALGTRLAGASLSLALAGVMAGCSGAAPKPAPLPSATPTTQHSPSPSTTTVAVPEIPTAASASTAAGAKTFAEYYLVLINYSIASGNTSRIRSEASDKCSGCEAIAKAIDDIYNAGGRVTGGNWREIAPVTVKMSDAQAVVTLPIRVTRQVVFARPSASPSATRPNNGRLELHLTSNKHRWSVHELNAYDR